MRLACAAVLFDCDGVLLDSNPIKTEAFRAALDGYPAAQVDQLVAFHQQHGGLSRYVKFQTFFTKILRQPVDEAKLARMLERFGAVCRRRYLEVPLTPSCRTVLADLSSRVPLFVVSGSDQAELQAVFRARELASYFQAVYGCPRPKTECVEEILKRLGSRDGVVLVGDSYLDWQTAQAHGLSFVFMARYSEAAERMRQEAQAHRFPVIDTLASLPELIAAEGIHAR